MTEDVWDLAKGATHRPKFSSGYTRALFETFVSGGMISVSSQMPPAKIKKQDRANLEQLVNLDEVWALCVRTPGSGWRFFGRFMEAGQLVLVTHYDRDLFPSLAAYQNGASQVLPLWDATFPKQPPHRGVTFRDYLPQGVLRNADKKAFE